MRYSKKKIQYSCKLCNHTWIGRNDYEPLQCPRCKRYDWNKVNKEEHPIVSNGTSEK